MTLATDRSSCFPVDPLLPLVYILHVQMLGLDDFEVVTDTLDSVLSVDNFQFSIGVVNRNSEMKMFFFSCE